MNTPHFNGLRPDEAERLAMLAEECAEVIQIIGKILRHGYEETHPDDMTISNRQLLSKEIADLFVIIKLMDGDFKITSAQELELILLAKKTYMHHQKY